MVLPNPWSFCFLPLSGAGGLVLMPQAVPLSPATLRTKWSSPGLVLKVRSDVVGCPCSQMRLRAPAPAGEVGAEIQNIC